ncbi:MAG TPA: 4Fe-4S binding protein [Bacillota bacterium]|nr:4Fe-4S binding protein [Bacillota bacterium]
MNSKNIYHIYYSPNGESKKIALYFHDQIQGQLIDLTFTNEDEFTDGLFGDLLILTLPVYSQNIPFPLRKILGRLHFKYTLINLTYGGFSYGNVLRHVQNLLKPSIVIGYSITPVKHAYIAQTIPIDMSQYLPLINRVLSDEMHKVKVPKRLGFFPTFIEKQITDFNYRLIFDRSLCNNCGLCISNCPTSAIAYPISFPKSCLRCGRCVQVCPKQAITGQKSIFVKIYFHKKQKANVIIR